MINLQTRSAKKELLDNEGVPFADIQLNMRELNTINTYLGGHAITISGLKNIIQRQQHNQSFTVCELGCGGGDNLVALALWCNRKKIPVRFIGIDIKPACIEFAKERCYYLPVEWITSDYSQVNFSSAKPDIIFSSLFCHHFTNEEMITVLQWMKQNSAKGFFISDLHRHPLAYYSIKLLTAAFSRSYLVKNDAPLSVARGFKKNEWRSLMKQAGITSSSVQWRWAFRHLITYCNE